MNRKVRIILGVALLVIVVALILVLALSGGKGDNPSPTSSIPPSSGSDLPTPVYSDDPSSSSSLTPPASRGPSTYTDLTPEQQDQITKDNQTASPSPSAAP